MSLFGQFARRRLWVALVGLLLLLTSCGMGGIVSTTNNSTPSSGGHTGTSASPAGTITEFPVPKPGSSLGGITVGPDGNLWFTVERIRLDASRRPAPSRSFRSLLR